MSAKPATIQDVARKANVSTATVSRALSSPDSVSPQKRAAVQNAIRATGYRVNRAARNLRTQRSNTVLALLPTLGNPFFSQVLKGIENVLTPAGLALVVAETGQMRAAGDDLVNYLDDQRADGVIVLDGALPLTSVQALQSSVHRTHVVFGCEWLTDGGFPSVRSANQDGAELAIDYLIGLGHRRIAHVTGPAGNVLTQARLDGTHAACLRHGVQPVLIPGDFTLEAGAKAASALLRLSPRPTAVFCAADVVAFGLISALAQAGVSVPGDISVVGFDDIELCEHFVPALTSIRQDRVALGAQTARMLLRCLAPVDAPCADTVDTVPVHLITRASTAPFA